MTTDEKGVFIQIQNIIVSSKALVLVNCVNTFAHDCSSFLVISTLTEIKGVSERFLCYYGNSLSQKDDLNIFSNDLSISKYYTSQLTYELNIILKLTVTWKSWLKHAKSSFILLPVVACVSKTSVPKFPVKIHVRVNVWTICRDQKRWPLRRGGRLAVRRGSTVIIIFSIDLKVKAF